jgi:hypothetical protein
MEFRSIRIQSLPAAVVFGLASSRIAVINRLPPGDKQSHPSSGNNMCILRLYFLNNYFPFLYNACAKNIAFTSVKYATASPPANLNPSASALFTSNNN